MESISLRLEGEILKDLERVMKKYRYSTKTEFIREAIRDKLNDVEKTDVLKNIDRIFGYSKKKTSEEDLHKARKKLEKIYENRLR